MRGFLTRGSLKIPLWLPVGRSRGGPRSRTPKLSGADSVEDDAQNAHYRKCIL